LSNLWVIAAAVFIAVMLGVQAIHLVFFRLRSTQKSINHRLTLSAASPTSRIRRWFISMTY
jgi:hypothetical protein